MLGARKSALGATRAWDRTRRSRCGNVKDPGFSVSAQEPLQKPGTRPSILGGNFKCLHKSTCVHSLALSLRPTESVQCAGKAARHVGGNERCHWSPPYAHTCELACTL